MPILETALNCLNWPVPLIYRKVEAESKGAKEFKVEDRVASTAQIDEYVCVAESG